MLLTSVVIVFANLRMLVISIVILAASHSPLVTKLRLLLQHRNVSRKHRYAGW